MPTASSCDHSPTPLKAAPGTRSIVLFGPPNAGKTSLYNQLTGSRYKTVNYPGATVDYALGRLKGRSDVVVLDTPGVVSVVPRTADERVAVETLTGVGRLVPGTSPTPEVVLTTVDATQPSRHLVLVQQLLRAGIQPVVVLTMNDLARAKGRALEPDRLSAALGIPVVAVDGRTGAGMPSLLAVIDDLLGGTAPVPHLPSLVTESELQADFRNAEAMVELALITGQNSTRRLLSDRIDVYALHPVFGLALFAIAMSFLFWCVFAAAAPFQQGIGWAVATFGAAVSSHLPDAWYSHLLVDGVVAGVGAVLVFVPQIAILFLLIGLLEDSGYLARGAVLVDRPLSAIGLNGRSFVPMLSGYACAIPAAMAARTIPGRKERLLTLLVIPLMSCSARLPVWGLLLAFLVPPGHAWAGGIALTIIYLASLAIASIAAWAGGRILGLEDSPTGFQIELPTWRTPILRNAAISALDRTASYLRRAGGTILTISVIFWALMNLPSRDASIAWTAGHWLAPVLHPMGLDWRVGISLLAAFAAREVFVSALAVVFSVDGAKDATTGVVHAMRDAVLPDGTHIFTFATCAGLVVFFLIALQCLSTVAVIRRESDSWKFAMGQMATFIGVAWILAVATVQGLRFLGVG
jgi:ferrous iron transport protein B